MHAAFAAKYPTASGGKDFYVVRDEEADFFAGCPLVDIECPAGSVVLWDSRSIHSGKEPEKMRAEPNIRNIAYICMVPRHFASPKMLEKKRNTFEAGRMTTHWPHRIRMFGKKPRTYGKPLAAIRALPRPVLNGFGRRLAGFND